MYESFYGFRERPFDLTPNPRFLVMTPSHQEALSNLEYAIASRKGVTLLLGEAGSGKTTLIRAAIERQPARVHTVHLHNPALTREEFIEILAARFGLSDRARNSKAALIVELEELLRARREAGETTLLVVDEAQSLSLELLEEIRLLANIETDEEKLLSLLIAGQPELADVLNASALRQLKGRVALRCELRPLSLQETFAYIAGRIRAAGGVGAHVFTREAVTLIHEQSKGIPRIVNVLADNALVAGFATEQRPVGSQLVREVCRDFDIGNLGAEERGDAAPAPAPAPAAAAAAAAPAETSVLDLRGTRSVKESAPAAKPAGEAADPGKSGAGSIFGLLSKRRFSFLFG
jgi:general secretion pathway protein A